LTCIDITLTGNTPFGEGHNVQFRVEMFSAMNHALFSLPNATVNSPAFGGIKRVRDARQISVWAEVFYYQETSETMVTFNPKRR
jgi:hypothetical protein